MNTPIPAGVATHPDSDRWLRLASGASDGGRLTSDPNQNSYAVYYADSSTPLREITLSGGYFSRYHSYDQNPDGLRTGAGFEPTIRVPVPDGARSGNGVDDQMLILDMARGLEWAFWRWDPDGDGRPNPTNGYVYDFVNGSGRTEDGGRGAGVAKLFGLVMAHDVEELEVVDHAIAVAFPGSMLTSDQYVYPATKSDGSGGAGLLPEGGRIQLDPSLTDADFDAMGLKPQARVVARAMQRYGMIIVDKSGRNKVFIEARHTGGWSLDDRALTYFLDPLVNQGGEVDWSRHFRVVDFDNWTGGPTGLLNER